MKYIFVFILIFVCSCQNGTKESETLNFTRDNFKQQIVLSNPEEITLEELLNPAVFYVIQDSILVVQNQLNCDYMLELYSINTLQPLAQVASKGNGPGEMSSCACFIESGTSSVFYIQDTQRNMYYTVNIDSILKSHELEFLNQFKYNSTRLPNSEICLLDNQRYVAYNMWYLDSKEFDNHISQPLAIHPIGEQDLSQSEQSEEFPYFVASVNGAHLLKNPVNGTIWAADMHKDQIDIYDDSLNLIKTLKGPDHFEVKYVRKQINAPVAFITFEDDKYCQAYSSYFLTDKHIYIIYEGNQHFNPENLQPVEVFKFDFEGNPIADYKLDHYVYSISVDKNEKFLYCSSRSTVMEPAKLLKYKL